MNTQNKLYCQIHCLPTDKSILGKDMYGFVLAKDYGFDEFNIANNFQHKPLHIYLTSNEKIKEDDWFINDDGLWQCKNIIPTGLNPRKVIATTNKSLKTYIPELRGVLDKYTYLPSIHESDIKEYVRRNGDWKECWVEMESPSSSFDAHLANMMFNERVIKTRPNGSVVILQEETKEKLYTKEEVINLIKYFANDCESNKYLISYNGTDEKGNKIWEDTDLSEWIKDNL